MAHTNMYSLQGINVLCKRRIICGYRPERKFMVEFTVIKMSSLGCAIHIHYYKSEGKRIIHDSRGSTTMRRGDALRLAKEIVFLPKPLFG